jgi:Zn-dependent peptidase ImmA (M78 family)
LDQDEPVQDVVALAKRLRCPLSFQERNHLPARNVSAAVGWRQGGEAIVAGPNPPREDSRRFVEARGLYHALFACALSPRLVTTAHTWDQQASRAFAAELLAPRRALVGRYEARAETEEFEELVASLAANYRVSTKIIKHQLENAGIADAAD